MINLREIEREFRLDGGDMGRGTMIDKKDLDELDTRGYKPFTIAASLGIQFEFPDYGCSGAPCAIKWRGFTREEDGKYYYAAVEYCDL